MLGLFTKKPSTVAGVFEKAVEDIRVIQDAQVAEQARLAEEQKAAVAHLDAEQERLNAERKALDDDFKEKSAANAKAKAASEKERMRAGKVIKKFAEMFGVDGK